MLDPARWRLRAEEYHAISSNSASSGGRTAYSELARLCERYAQRLELPSAAPSDGLDTLPTPRELPGNKLLAIMSDADVRLLTPHLHAIDFTKHHCFSKPNQPIEHVYFLEEGMASVNAVLTEEKHIETGVIGPEGMTSIGVVMGDDQSPTYTYGEIPGRALRIEASALRAAINHSHTLHSLLLKYAHIFFTQVAYTALANGRCNIEDRLARWLLMAQDRIQSADIPLTHEFLSVMLGVRRAGVTVALHELEARGLVRVVRTRISVVDRSGLLEMAGNSYGPPEAAYKRLIG